MWHKTTHGSLLPDQILVINATASVCLAERNIIQPGLDLCKTEARETGTESGVVINERCLHICACSRMASRLSSSPKYYRFLILFITILNIEIFILIVAGSWHGSSSWIWNYTRDKQIKFSLAVFWSSVWVFLLPWLRHFSSFATFGKNQEILDEV